MDPKTNIQLKPPTRRLIVAFAALLLIPALAGFFSDHKLRAKWEKRELTGWQEVTAALAQPEFFPILETYFDDHMGFALQLNGLYRLGLYYVFGDSPVPSVSVGDDGFVFLNTHAIYPPHSAIKKACTPKPESVRQNRQNMTLMGEWAQRNGAGLTFAFVPSKVLLYPDRLPATVPAAIREACLKLKPQNVFASHLARPPLGSPYQAYYPLLEMRYARDFKAFYPPGNFHANSMLNHYFSRGLLLLLNLDPGRQYSSGRQLRTIKGDLTSMGFPRQITAWTYPYAHYRIIERDSAPAWIPGVYPKVREYVMYETAHPISNRKALLLSDSFGAYIAPHLAPGFASLLHINMNAIKKGQAGPLLAAVAERFQPDEIIYLMHDAGMPDSRMNRIGEELTAP